MSLFDTVHGDKYSRSKMPIPCKVSRPASLSSNYIAIHGLLGGAAILTDIFPNKYYVASDYLKLFIVVFRVF